MSPRRRCLAQRRRTMGYSQERLAERLGVDRTTIARWESGETAPLAGLRPRVASVLGLSLEQLDDMLDDIAPTDSSNDDRLTRAMASPAGIDLVAIARLRDSVQELDRRYDTAPSTSLLADTGQCLAQAAFLRAHAISGKTRRELLIVETEAAILMARLVWDASQRRDHRTAKTHLDRAAATARQLHDPVAEGHALLRRSFVALYGENDAQAGLCLTKRSAELTAQQSPALAGLAILHTAEAHAILGDFNECEAALARAQDCLAGSGPDDVSAELLSPAHYGRLAGSCYLFLNAPARAEPVLRTTAEALSGQTKSQAIVLGNLALALIRQRKIEEAASCLNRAIDVVETTRGGGGVNIVFRACQELRPWRSEPDVDDVHDRLLMLMAST
ncbi:MULTISPECIES: helix-turn-helix transcriptional regulator [unclassified Pseudonocardia]|uniref:helix-turn-helix domain-containing protein n=1 Tax=unclassified Pseudonocardia TaxID=2619320 RepID=UPI00094B2EFE|nr:MULTISPECIES: helix-turn-helix transcriptional regulator [unclassified Pseudonocardia]